MCLAFMILAGCSTASLLASLPEHSGNRPLTAHEQAAYVGGEDPVVVDVPSQPGFNKQCLQPNGSQSPTSLCNKADTPCVNHAYCNEQRADLVCDDTKDYQNPLECITVDTELQCLDDGALTVTCYKVKECFCKLVENQWRCVVLGQEVPRTILKCKNASGPVPP